MAQKPHGLCQGPSGAGVSGVPTMVDGEGGLEVGVGQIPVKLPHALAVKHTLSCKKMRRKS